MHYGDTICDRFIYYLFGDRISEGLVIRMRVCYTARDVECDCERIVATKPSKSFVFSIYLVSKKMFKDNCAIPSRHMILLYYHPYVLPSICTIIHMYYHPYVRNVPTEKPLLKNRTIWELHYVVMYYVVKKW